MSAARVSHPNMSVAQLEKLAQDTECCKGINRSLLAIKRGELQVDEAKAGLADKIARNNLELRAAAENSRKLRDDAAQRRANIEAQTTAKNLAAQAERQAKRNQHEIRTLPLNARNAAEQRASQRMSHGWWGENKRHIIALTRWVKPLLIAITLVAFLILLPLVIL